MQNRSKQSLTKVLTYFTDINQDCIQNKCSDDLSACGDDFNDCHERMSAAFFYRIRPGSMMVGCECIRKLMRATSRLYRQRSKRQWLMLRILPSQWASARFVDNQFRKKNQQPSSKLWYFHVFSMFRFGYLARFTRKLCAIFFQSL